MKDLRTPLTCAGIALLAGCAGAPPGSARPGLLGVEWVVESIDGAGVVERSRATLNFGRDGSEGRVTGEAPCNRYTGPYTLRGETLSFGNLAATRRACAPALMQQETRFFEALARVQRFEFTPDGALVLRGEPGRSIQARRG